jgi:hypothetical protein
MLSAYVLIQTEVGKVAHVAQAISFRPGSCSGVRAPRPCRWSSDRSGPATTRSVGVADPGRPRAAVVVTACTTPRHSLPGSQPRRACRVRAGLGIERAWWSRPEGSGEYALTPRAGWCGGRRAGAAAPCGPRLLAVALPRGRGWPSDRATKTTWGRFPVAEPLFHQARGCRRMTREYRWRRVDTGHRRLAGGAWVVLRRRH